MYSRSSFLKTGPRLRSRRFFMMPGHVIDLVSFVLVELLPTQSIHVPQLTLFDVVLTTDASSASFPLELVTTGMP